jgi:carbonic anhydrase
MDQNILSLPAAAFQSLDRLKSGNSRFSNGTRSVHSGINLERLKKLATEGQAPFSIVLTCSDSRIPVESVFDCGVGELFVIRLAGNVVSPEAIASIEYAVENLKTPLCVVMGHTRCGAVQAAAQFVQEPSQPHASPHVQGLIEEIVPSIHQAMSNPSDGWESRELESIVSEAIFANVNRTLTRLQQESEIVHQLVSSRQFGVVGAVFDLHTGKVTFSTEHEEFVPDVPAKRSAACELSESTG